MDTSREQLLRRLITTPSPSGFEQSVQQVIREEISHYSDEMRTDIHGNVIAALHPHGTPRVMLAAHCDELGFLIRYIDDQGFLYFSPIGGYDPSTLPGERVFIHTEQGPILGVIGRKPVHLLTGDERAKAPTLSELWIDIGVENKEAAQQLIPLGSVATRAAELEHLRGELVVSRGLDNKAGVFTIIEAMRRLHEQRETLQAGAYFASTVQEEIGLRGARTSAFSIDPLIALVVDVVYTSDHPQTSKKEIGDIQLNGGPVLTMGGFINPRIYQLLVKTAEAAGIPWQLDLQVGTTGTDTDPIQIARAGIATGLINIPCRYLHTGSEIASLKDMDQVAELIARFILALDQHTSVIP